MKKVLLLLAALIGWTASIHALVITPGKYYTIANRNDNNIYVKDLGEERIRMGALDDASYWEFISTGNPNRYYVKNKKTQRYAQLCSTSTGVEVQMGTEPVEYIIIDCSAKEGTDCFGLTTTNQTVQDFTYGAIGWNWKEGDIVQTFAAVAGTNHRSFWKLTQVELEAPAIDPNKFYTISNRNDNNIYVKDDKEEEIGMGSLDKAALWQFIPTETGNQYYVKNVLTGRYAQECSTSPEIAVKMGTEPVEYIIIDCSAKEGTVCFGLTTTNQTKQDFTNGAIGWNWRNDNVVQTFAAVAGTNHRSFWKLTPMDAHQIGESGYATYYTTKDIKILGAQAYIGSMNTPEYLTLTEIPDIPAHTAVVLKGSAYSIMDTQATTDVTTNILTGAVTTMSADGTQYCLANMEEGVGFYKVKTGTEIPQGKAYITISGEGNVKEFLGFYGDTSTGLLRNFTEKGHEAIYNLNGQRIQRWQKGIYIVDGKKILK